MRKKRNWSESDTKLAQQATSLTEEIHGIFCPSCKSNQYSKNGKVKGNQKYICKKCRKNFRSTTGYTIHHLHLKSKVKEYIETMQEGLPLRKVANKLGICLQTAFRWRHKFLSDTQNSDTILPKTNQVISAYNLPFSNKGSKKLFLKTATITNIVQIDYSGSIKINILGHFGQSKSEVAKQLPTSLSITPSKSIPRIIKQKSSQKLNQRQMKTVKNLHKEISNWLQNFRGVATKYLNNYWNWFMTKRKSELEISKTDQHMFQFI